jgi:Ca2+-binding RTX toxin-like protein
VTFDVYLTGTAAANITINYSVIAPSDGYFDAAAFGGTLPSGHVTIAAGQTMGQVTLQLNNSNLQPELGSNVAVQITPPNGVPVFAATAQTAIIGSVPMTIGDNTANLLFPTAQTEIIQGRGATDTVLFNAPHTDYTIANPASGVTVTGADGVHTLLSIESVKFTDWNVAITTANAYTMPTDVNEVVFHGTGHFAGTGNGLANTIVGGQGADTLNGGGGIDSLNGGSGDDTMFGGAGKDTLIGGDGNDTLVGNDSGPGVFLHEANTLTGGNGNDTLIGEVSDTVSGGAGLDTLQAENANPWTINLGATSIETMLAGFGDDHVDASTQTAGVTVFASGGNDTVTGSGFNDFLWGGVGNDTLTGGSGNDLLFGDLGADSLSGGAGNDTLYGDNSDTHIDGGAGTDALYWAAGANANINVGADAVEFVQTLGNNDTLNGATATANLVLFAGAGNDTVTGGSGNDFLWGEAGNDVLVGNGGNDTIVGGTGADKLTGGAGTDNLFGGNGSNTGDGAADTFVFTAGWGTDFVYGFDDGIDKLDMTASGATQFSQLAVTSSNGNADVDFGTNHIIVVGQAGHIAAGDFIFAP